MVDSIDYYNRYAAAYYEQTVDLDMSEVMQPFVEMLPEDAEVLDLGCGSGRDTLALKEFGFYVTAMDGSSELCKLAEIYLDQEVLNLTFEEMDFEDVFDGIWACASLVHVEPKAMPGILKKIFTALKAEGILYFSVYEGDRDGIYGEDTLKIIQNRRYVSCLRRFPMWKLLISGGRTMCAARRTDIVG